MDENEDPEIEVLLNENDIAVLPPGLVARGEFLSQFKGATLGEYTIDEDGNSAFNLLVRSGDKFRWIDVVEAIPADSEREYPTLSVVR